MGNLQVLFIVLFGIYFATSVSTVGKFHPFDTTASAMRDWRALLRCVLALVLLDLLPFAYFIWVLTVIPADSADFVTDWRSALAVLFASLGVFGIYRLFVSVMMIRRRASDALFFYSLEDDWPRDSMRAEMAAVRIPDSPHPRPGPVLLGAAIWLGLSVVLFLLLIG